MLSVTKFPFTDTEHWKIAAAIRTEVFVVEQSCDRDEEYDGLDQTATHYLIYSDDIPVGCARMRETKNGVKLERFAVLAPFRGKGIGAEIVRKVLEDAKKLGKEIYLHAQLPAMSLYKRAGFEATGPEFTEANIQHYKMVFKG